MVGIEQFLRLVARMFDERRFLSPYGLRALSAYHRESPYVVSGEGFNGSIDDEPAESTTSMFGGNSNWRGPGVVPAQLPRLQRCWNATAGFSAQRYVWPSPRGRTTRKSPVRDRPGVAPAQHQPFSQGDNGRRPIFGTREKMQTDPRWRDNLVFNEYFNGDTGEGLGASHQTGWTGLVADQIRRVHNPDLLSLLRGGSPALLISE